MAFSYSGNPVTSTLDALRFATGDTHEPLSLLTDEEAQWMLVTYGTPNAALIPTLRTMLAKTMHDTLIQVDGIRRDLTERRLALQSQLDTALTTVAYNIATPFLGGVSVSARDVRRQDTGLIQPIFTASTPEESA